LVLVFGAVLLATFGWVIIEGDNPDFPLFGSPVLNIAMFASIFILFGVLLAPLFDWVARVLPAPSLHRRYRFLVLPASYSPLGLGSLAVTAFSLFITVQLVAAIAFGFGEEGDTATFVRALGLYALFVPAIAGAMLVLYIGKFQRLSDLRQHRGAMAGAVAVLALPVVAGLYLTARAIVDILKAAA
jgi:hypothetical protein